MKKEFEELKEEDISMVQFPANGELKIPTANSIHINRIIKIIKEVIAILVLSCLKLSEVNSIPIPNTKSKEPIIKKSNILQSTELVSIMPRSGIIKRDNGYSAFFEIFKFIMIFLKNL